LVGSGSGHSSGVEIVISHPNLLIMCLVASYVAESSCTNLLGLGPDGLRTGLTKTSRDDAGTPSLGPVSTKLMDNCLSIMICKSQCLFSRRSCVTTHIHDG